MSEEKPREYLFVSRDFAFGLLCYCTGLYRLMAYDHLALPNDCLFLLR